jgi:hypothetical protein
MPVVGKADKLMRAKEVGLGGVVEGSSIVMKADLLSL